MTDAANVRDGSRIYLLDPDDRGFVVMARCCAVTRATLPSGFVVPDAPNGQRWVTTCILELISNEDWQERQHLLSNVKTSDEAKLD